MNYLLENSKKTLITWRTELEATQLALLGYTLEECTEVLNSHLMRGLDRANIYCHLGVTSLKTDILHDLEHILTSCEVYAEVKPPLLDVNLSPKAKEETIKRDIDLYIDERIDIIENILNNCDE